MMGILRVLVIVTAISRGMCTLGEGEVFPVRQTISPIHSTNDKCNPRNQRTAVCGWTDIGSQECTRIGCCWNRLRMNTPCFRYIGTILPPGARYVAPRPTNVTSAQQRGAVNRAPQIPVSRPVVDLSQLHTNREVRLSTVSSDVSYNGCLLHCTSLPTEKRRTCLFNVAKDVCTNVGCCYDEKTNHCFHSNWIKDDCPKSDECQVTLSPVPVCGNGNYPKRMCEAIGCCHNNISGVPTCYRQLAVGRQETPSTTAPPAPATTTLDFAAQLAELQNLFETGQLSSLLPPNMLPNPSVPPPVNPAPTAATTPLPPTRPPGSGTTDTLDQLKEIQSLLEAGLLPTLLPTTDKPAVTKPAVTTQATTTTPPKTAAGVQRWQPQTQYEWRCDGTGPCRYVVKSCLPRTCGDPPHNPTTVRNNYDPRKIVGGSRAFEFSHPWTVMIQKVEGNKTYVCGGTIICAQWVVTAAHCLDKQGDNTNEPDLSPEKYKLYFGRYNGIRSFYGYQVQVFKGTRDIEALVQHENFIPGKHRGVITHDIALIKLKRPVIFNRYVHPICLPREQAKPGEIMFATGWGISRNIGPDPTTLKQLGVEIKSRINCRNRVPGFRDPVGVLCAGGEPNQDTCTGDSGGPLVGSKLAPVGQMSFKGKPIYYFYGLTSIGSPSCNTRQFDRQPALYTDVHYYLPWIRKNTADCCS